MLLNNSEQWFAVHVKPRAERPVANFLRTKGYEEFLPTRELRSVKRSTRGPLFPGYLFCRMRPDCQGLIVTTPGVIRIVGAGGKPIPIDPEEINSLQIIVNSGLRTCTWEGLHLGDKVFIREGPLFGAVGVLTSIRAKQRLVITITMMMRSVAAEVQPEWVTALNPLPKRVAFEDNQKYRSSSTGYSVGG